MSAEQSDYAFFWSFTKAIVQMAENYMAALTARLEEREAACAVMAARLDERQAVCTEMAAMSEAILANAQATQDRLVEREAQLARTRVELEHAERNFLMERRAREDAERQLAALQAVPMERQVGSQGHGNLEDWEDPNMDWPLFGEGINQIGGWSGGLFE